LRPLYILAKNSNPLEGESVCRGPGVEIGGAPISLFVLQLGVLGRIIVKTMHFHKMIYKRYTPYLLANESSEQILLSVAVIEQLLLLVVAVVGKIIMWDRTF
jgi:hypothetical protein